MIHEKWYSIKYDDFIQLHHSENYWKGIGDGFEFRRHSKTEAIMLLILWGYKKVE